MSNPKLQNIKAIKQLLTGNHRWQTRTIKGWEPKKDFKVRQVGDVWEETTSTGAIIEWEQMQGYKRRRHKNMKELLDLQLTLKEYPNCYEDCEKKTTKKYSRYDEETRVSSGMCLDCLAKFETHLMVKGEFSEYKREKDLASALAFFKDAEKEKEIIKEAVSTIEFMEENGRPEKWTMENKEAFLQKIDNDFEKLKRKILEPLENGN